MTGTSAQWREWTDPTFPATGDHVPPWIVGTRVERDRDLGTSVEPNVSVRHR